MDDELAFLATATATSEQSTDANLVRDQVVTSPLLMYPALEHRATDFPSRGLLGTSAGSGSMSTPTHPVALSSAGSGKSHTVSCLLECALIGDTRVGQLPEPLSALVSTSSFHFDAQDTNRPCEAAFVSVPKDTSRQAALPQVTVLCSPSNVNRRRRAYASLANVHVEPLCLSEKDLTADRMLSLMGCDNLETMPLYMHTALLIIRTMGVDAFSYLEFKRQISLQKLDPKQKAMIKLRLDLLDAFVRPDARDIESYFTNGGLVLVDLTDPFLDGLTASVLFDIVLGAFTQWQTACGKLVVLDEAHKYLTNSDSARLTQSVSNTIRLQRHLATRVIIATQEPTVIPPTILDLASVIICHRFSSPAWCAHLAHHVSAGHAASHWRRAGLLPRGPDRADERGGVSLLGREHLRLRVRPRLTMDGGASRLAVGRALPLPPPAASPPTPPASFSPLSLPTSPTSASTLPVPRLQGTTTAPPAVKPTASAPRAVPARLKHLVGHLLRGGAENTPLPLTEVATALTALNLLPDVKKSKGWWTQMLQEAVDQGFVEVINGDVPKQELRARGEVKRIRLLDRRQLL
ncbi:hypothetical protein B0H13DRAFT_2316839 [Mycena leptocephala]|nr:hypothetical protein B0H13DRAFT_2316839 [Mycena leptocephala]